MFTSQMWVNLYSCTFSEFTVVEIQNPHYGVLGAILATSSVLTLGDYVFLVKLLVVLDVR